MPTIYRNGTRYSGVTYLAGSGITAGIITAYAGTKAPTGWLLCDGSAVSREMYSELFDAIGTTYGSGDGSTTFNLPDLRGRVVVGEGTGTASDATAHALGQKAGVEDAIIPYHDHGFTNPTIPNHTHKAAWGNFVETNTNLWMTSKRKYTALDSSGISYVAGSAEATVDESNTTANGGGGGATTGGSVHYAGTSDNTIGANMQPYTVLNYIISIGQQNGGFTHIEYDPTEDEYNGGIEDKYLLTDDTITEIETWLNSGGGDISRGLIDQTLDYIANYVGDCSFASSIDIYSAATSQNGYKVPEDGYITFQNNASTSGDASIYIDGEELMYLPAAFIPGWSKIGVFVKKGSVIRLTNSFNSLTFRYRRINFGDGS